MASITYLSPGGDESAGLLLFKAVTGTAAYDTTQKNTGAGSYKFSSGAAGTEVAYGETPAGTVADAGTRGSFYFRVEALPTANVAILRIRSASSTCWYINLNGTTSPAYHLGIVPAVGGSFVYSAGAISAATWYRLEWAQVLTSTTDFTITVWLTPVGGSTETFQCTSGTIRVASSLAFFGATINGLGVNKSMWVDDIYMDDGATLDQTGDIRLTAKLPASREAGSGFDNNSVAMSDAVRTTAVSQRPNLEATVDVDYITHYDTTDVYEAFTLEAAGAGDVDISADTVVGYMGWVRHWLSSTTGTPAWDMVLNGTDYALPDTGTTHTTSIHCITSATYPSNGKGIGLTSSVIAANTFLAEAGVVVAYTPAGEGTETPQAVDATVGATATVLRSAGKRVIATSGVTGTVARAVSRVVSATTGAAGTIKREVSRAVSATVGSTGAVIKQASRSIAATAGTTAALVVTKVKLVVIPATVGTTATVKRAVSRTVSAAQATSATITRAASRTVSVVQATAATVTKQAGHAVSATAGATATLTRQVGKRISAVVSTVADLVANKIAGGGTITPQAVDAVVGTTAALTRQVGKRIGATAGTAAGLVRAIARTVTATSATVTAAIKAGSHSIAATTASAAALTVTKVKIVLVNATTGAMATIRRQVGKVSAAAVGTTGTTRRAVSRTVAAATPAGATVTKAVSRALSVTAGTTATAVVRAVRSVVVAATVTTSAALTRAVGHLIRATSTVVAAMTRVGTVSVKGFVSVASRALYQLAPSHGPAGGMGVTIDDVPVGGGVDVEDE